jgi:hypothetical protein
VSQLGSTRTRFDTLTAHVVLGAQRVPAAEPDAVPLEREVADVAPDQHFVAVFANSDCAESPAIRERALDIAAQKWRFMCMKVLGFRFCTVSPEAPKLASFLDAIGFERHPLEGGSSDGPFAGAVFAAGESWLAMWPPSSDMPAGMMLQVVVDDADAFAARAREQGLSPVGPTDSQNKRLYFLQAPTGLQMSIQSRLPGQREESLPAPPVVQQSLPAAVQQTQPVPARARPNKLPAPPLAPRGTGSVAPPAASGRVQSSAPPAATKRSIQTVVLPAAPPARGQGSAPPPPAPGRRGAAPLPPAPARVRNLAAPPPPPVVARRAPPR